MKKHIFIAVAALLSVAAAAGECWSSADPSRYGTASFAKALWHETFSGPEEPFTVEYCGGAEGKVEIVPEGGRSEKRALRTVKSNYKGYILIKFKNAIPVKPGNKLQFNAFYQGRKNLPLYSRAMLRMQIPGQNDFKLFSFCPGITGGEAMQQIIVTPDNTWERKFTQRKADAGMSLFEPVLIIAGAPSEVLWDDFYIEDDNISADNWNTFFNRRVPADRSKEMISDAELDRLIAADAEHTGKVAVIDGKSRLLIDGEVTAPIINGPYGKFITGKNYSSAGDFAKLGIHLHKVSIRLGEGYPAQTYPGCWKGKDRLDLSGAMEQIRNTLKLDPKGRIILSIGLHPYWRFTGEYPSEAWIGKTGKPVRGSGIHINESLNSAPSPSNYVWPSYHSEVLQSLYREQIAVIIAELKRTGLSKSIVGLHICGGHDGQMTVTHFDYSEPAMRAFRRFLKEEYGTVENLRAAWKDNGVTFENADAPDFSGSDDCLYPDADRSRIDFFRFSKFSGWRMAGEIAEYARKMMGKDVFTVRWCMGPYSGSDGASLDLYDFLTRQKFDILVAQASYNRRPPSQPCVPLLALDSFHLHGKIYVNEFDIRTWNAAPSWEKEIMSITWGLMIDFPMWQAAHRKLAGSMFARDMGFWYLDMAPGWFHHPRILQDIRGTAETGMRLVREKPSAWRPQAALVIDDDGMFLRNVPSSGWMFDVTMLVQEQITLLGASGVPFACYSLNDLIDRPELAKSFKVLVFAAMYDIDARRRKLLDSLKNSNRTLIFLSGTGRLGGMTGGSEITLGVTDRIANHHVSAAEGVSVNMLSPWMNKKDVHPKAAPAWYDKMKIVYAVARPGDRILARFEANGEPAVIERDNKGWKAVYIGEAGGLSPQYFHQLADQAGAYHIGDSGFQCETNGRFMMIHCLKSGEVRFRMPFRADVTNLCSGEVRRGVTEIPVRAEAGSTWFFELTPAG